MCQKQLTQVTLTQITKTEIFTFIAVLVVKLHSRKVLFINKKKTIETVKKSRLSYCKIIHSWNAKFSGYF